MDGSAEDRYKPSKEIRNKTSMVRSDVWDFINAYILQMHITLTESADINFINVRSRFLAFKKNCIS